MKKGQVESKNENATERVSMGVRYGGIGNIYMYGVYVYLLSLTARHGTHVGLVNWCIGLFWVMLGRVTVRGVSGVRGSECQACLCPTTTRHMFLSFPMKSTKGRARIASVGGEGRKASVSSKREKAGKNQGSASAGRVSYVEFASNHLSFPSG